jgi:hypothetical protein
MSSIMQEETRFCPLLTAKIGTCMPRSIRDSYYDVDTEHDIVLVHSRDDTFRYDSGDVIVTWDFYAVRTGAAWRRVTVAYEKDTGSTYERETIQFV